MKQIKNSVIVLIGLFLSASAIMAQSDTTHTAEPKGIHKKYKIPEKDSTKIFQSKPDSTGTVTDADGNVYHTITIGSQVWMVENLRTTKYNDGTEITHTQNAKNWQASKSGAYCNYNNFSNADSIAAYGRLYNWHAVKTGKLAPKGWHVPSDEEWATLIDSLGGESVAGGKLKEAGTAHWASPNTGATNEAGFCALPSGCCDYYGSFRYLANNCFWWSSTGTKSHLAIYRSLSCNHNDSNRGEFSGQCGCAVRCVKD